MTFNGADTGLNDMVAAWTGCVSCGLAEGRTTQVWGRPVGSLDVGQLVIVGEAPGRDEDLAGEAFVGRSGKKLDGWLEDAGVTDAFITNVVVCRPPNNRDPKRSELRKCWGRLFRTLKALQPPAVIAVGKIAGQWLLETDKSVGHMAARVYDLKVSDFRTKVIPVHHPAYYLRRNDRNMEAGTVERFRLAKRIIQGV